MSPKKWFLFLAGAGGVVGLVLLLGERRALGGTISTEMPTVVRSKSGGLVVDLGAVRRRQ